MKNKPAPLARRRVVKNKTLVDATRISPRQEEVQPAVAGPRPVLHPRTAHREASHRHTRVTAGSATVAAVCRCDGQNLGGST
jgi:hypothetical protein